MAISLRPFLAAVFAQSCCSPGQGQDVPIMTIIAPTNTKVPTTTNFNLAYMVTSTKAVTMGSADITISSQTSNADKMSEASVSCSNGTAFKFNSDMSIVVLHSVGGDLKPGSSWKYTIGPGCVTDGVTETPAVTGTHTVRDPATRDTHVPGPAPLPKTRLPMHNSYLAGATLEFSLHASEDVSLGESAITLTAENGIKGSPVKKLTPAPSTSGSKVIVSSPEVMNGAKYTVICPVGSYKDALGNTNGVQSSWSVIKPTSATAYNPTGLNVSISAAQRLSITFYDSVKSGTGTAIFYDSFTNGVGDDAAQTFTYDYLGKTVIMTLSANLRAAKTYTVGFPAGFFEYVDAIAATATNAVWSFSTVADTTDRAPPKILAGRIKCHTFADGCDVDGDSIYDHFNLTTDALAPDAKIVLVPDQTVQFQVFYNESVALSNLQRAHPYLPQRKATLSNYTTSKVGTLAIIADGTHKVIVDVTSLEQACEYKLEIPPDAVSDTVGLFAPGVTFSFSTILTKVNTANVLPVGSAVDLNTLIKIPFTAVPAPALRATIDILDKSTAGAAAVKVPFTGDQVVIEGTDIVLRNLNLKAATRYSVTLAPDAVFGLKQVATWEFTTRAADKTKIDEMQKSLLRDLVVDPYTTYATAAKKKERREGNEVTIPKSNSDETAVSYDPANLDTSSPSRHHRTRSGQFLVPAHPHQGQDG